MRLGVWRLDHEDSVAVTKPLRVGEAAGAQRAIRQDVSVTNSDLQLALEVDDALCFSTWALTSQRGGQRAFMHHEREFTRNSAFKNAELAESLAKDLSRDVN